MNTIRIKVSFTPSSLNILKCRRNYIQGGSEWYAVLLYNHLSVFLVRIDRHIRYMDQSSLKKIFLESFDTYNDALFRFCIVKTSNKELAEDLTQETFTRYWLALKEGKTMTNTRSFLYTIANHLVIDWYRRKKPSSLDALASEGFQPQRKILRFIAQLWKNNSFNGNKLMLLM